MLCRNCGNYIKENANFCENCGNKVEKQEIQPKKNNGCLIATVIGIILLFLIPILLIIFLTSFSISLVHSLIEEKTTCEDNGGTWIVVSCDYDNQKEKIKNENIIEENNDNKIKVNQNNKIITYRINNNNVERIIDDEIEILNINNEKAKKIVKGEATDIYILTEEGNIYICSKNIEFENPISKYEDEHIFKDIVVVNPMSEIYNIIHPGEDETLVPDNIVGKTIDDEYIIINSYVLNNINEEEVKEYIINEIIKKITG